MARPTKYNTKTARTICNAIMNGKSVRAICKSSTMPSKATVFRWLKCHSHFEESYRQAIQIRKMNYLDEVIHIADNATQKTLVISKLRIESLKWYLARLAPRVYQ